LERYTLGESSKWRIHRTKLRDVDWDYMDMLKEWMSTGYHKDYLKWRWEEEDPRTDHACDGETERDLDRRRDWRKMKSKNGEIPTV
jgi:hypothetical protein